MSRSNNSIIKRRIANKMKEQGHQEIKRLKNQLETVKLEIDQLRKRLDDYKQCVNKIREQVNEDSFRYGIEMNARRGCLNSTRI